jgi:hypothetical protein
MTDTTHDTTHDTTLDTTNVNTNEAVTYKNTMADTTCDTAHDTTHDTTTVNTKESVIIKYPLTKIANHGYSLTWFKMIFTYLLPPPNSKGQNNDDRFLLRRMCRLFHSALLPIPETETYVTFPHRRFATLQNLISHLNTKHKLKTALRASTKRKLTPRQRRRCSGGARKNNPINNACLERLNSFKKQHNIVNDSIPVGIVIEPGTYDSKTPNDDKTCNIPVTFPISIFAKDHATTIIKNLRFSINTITTNKQVCVKNLTFMDTNYASIFAKNTCSLLLANCHVLNCGTTGIILTNVGGSFDNDDECAILENCEVKLSKNNGLSISHASNVKIVGDKKTCIENNCRSQSKLDFGVSVDSSSTLRMSVEVQNTIQHNDGGGDFEHHRVLSI